jgi:AraC family transcriptional regulator of adaptative response/methylated-DNA-[protein]-cysteine methyltransferase
MNMLAPMLIKDAARPQSRDNGPMASDSERIDDDRAWAAVMRRDRAADGSFVTGVLTTGIYCRPSCAARHPKRENVRFYRDGEAARRDGLRPCLRCKPDEVSREAAAMEKAIGLIRTSEEMPTLEALAEITGYSPFHFHRVFKRATGVTPAAFARAERARRMTASLGQSERITDAIYDSGYSGPARFYADAKARLGMTPSAWRDGGRGETIRWTKAQTSLGTMFLAATEKGICRLSFEEDEADLRLHFPQARVEPGGEELRRLAEQAVEVVEAPERAHDLPLDVRGTAFQEAVWRELSRIPAGESLSYAALAAKAGKPGAARAAGTACGANPVAILIPCHRARRGDGTPGGYAYGLERKRRLVEHEARSAAAGFQLSSG